METIKEKEKDQVAYEYINVYDRKIQEKDDIINECDKQIKDLTAKYLQIEKELKFINDTKIGKIAKKVIKKIRRID